ncbi:hypothetical protein EMCRGX_G008471 [Ephydatia muelleri]
MAGYLPTRPPAVPVVLPSLLSMHCHVQKVAFLPSGTMRSETILPISCQKSATTFQLSLIFNPSETTSTICLLPHPMRPQRNEPTSVSDPRSSKDALKRHLQGHFLSKEPELSEDMIHQAGFTICTTCNSVLVTARRNRCNTCISSCRMSRVSTQSSCSGNSQAPASPACTEHSESSQVPYSPICTSSSSLVLAQESDMEPYSSRVPVSLGNLRPASDPATLITPIRQDAPTHSTSCSSSHVSIPQVSYVMDSPELPHSSTQHPVQSITPQGFETGPEPARSSQSPASSTISSPSHTPIFSHAHSPSTLTTGVPYEEALLCTTPSSSGHNTRGRKALHS